MACVRQDLPSHRTAAWPVELCPTASQKLIVRHDTLPSSSRRRGLVRETCAGLGVGWIFHAAPFQTSAKLT